MTNQLVLWVPQKAVKIPPTASHAREILQFANSHQLSARDTQQITAAFERGHYEMASSFIWTKAVSALKAQLGKLGIAFISEMLDRPDIDTSSSIDRVLTDYEALRLAEELGVINSTGALRLRQSLESLTHYGSLSPEESDASMTVDEAVRMLRACVENVLGQQKIEAAVNFKAFRDGLESKLFQPDDSDIVKLTSSPYFFYRASVRILLALIKSAKGAQLENTLGNANLIIPLLWERLLGPEKYQIGRAYAELASEGKSTATAGVRKVLLKVRGFDFVPEDLRSKSFSKAANAVLEAHEGINNFHNEPAPTRFLEQMGSIIPIPAFPICMTAVLSVKLGNRYGYSYEAQQYAKSVLGTVRPERWSYFLNDCLKSDERILYKLLDEKPRERWLQLCSEFGLAQLVDTLNDADVKKLVLASSKGNAARVQAIATGFIRNLGFASES
jgi:hypothetical protein